MTKIRRPTPYDLVFAGEPFETGHFPAIRAEIEASPDAVRDAESFLRLGRVAALMKELVPPDAPGAAIREYAALLYHGYRFWEHERYVLRLDREAARAVVEGPEPPAAAEVRPPRPAGGVEDGPPRPAGAAEIRPPRPAGYVQLPRHLFWARVAENATAEAVDGFFWTWRSVDDRRPDGESADRAGEVRERPGEIRERPGATGDPAGGTARLDLLLILGIMPNRAGFSAIDVGAPVPEAGMRHWAEVDARPGARDFENVLPGGELEGLCALVTELEALKLASRVFARAGER